LVLVEYYILHFVLLDENEIRKQKKSNVELFLEASGGYPSSPQALLVLDPKPPIF
jgi:hypothetical protein